MKQLYVVNHLHQRKLSQLLFKEAFEVWRVLATAATPDLACFHHFIEGEPSIALSCCSTDTSAATTGRGGDTPRLQPQII